MSKYWVNIERKRRRYITKYYRELKRDLNDVIKPILELFKYSTDIDGLKSMAQHIDTSRINDTLIEMYGDIGRDFGVGVRRFIKNLPEKKDLEEDLWQEYMEQWAIREAGTKIVSINKYTKEEFLSLVQREIQIGQSEGLGTNEIAARLRKTLPLEWERGSAWKARRIAQTEVIGASNRASLAGAEALGYEMTKTWLTAPSGVAKNERHTLPGAIQEYTIPLKDKFLVDGGYGYEAMLCPGDGSAENVINCRCSITFEVL